MNLAFTTAGATPDALLDPRFGRAPGFLVVDLDTGKYRLIGNSESVGTAQGAGIQAAQRLARAGADGIVTGHCGPKAFQVLTAAGIKIYCTNASTIREALDEFTSGKLTVSSEADVEGHWD